MQSGLQHITTITALCLLLQVEKGTQGIDSIVISNKGKGEQRMGGSGHLCAELRPGQRSMHAGHCVGHAARCTLMPACRDCRRCWPSPALASISTSS